MCATRRGWILNAIAKADQNLQLLIWRRSIWLAHKTISQLILLLLRLLLYSMIVQTIIVMISSPTAVSHAFLTAPTISPIEAREPATANVTLTDEVECNKDEQLHRVLCYL
jgi:hypothetical protein